MKKIFFSLMIVSALFFASCGGSSVEQSPEMKDFISMFKGSSDDVSAALEKYASTDELKNHDMAMYDLKDAKVVSGEGDCYTAEFAAGITTHKYKFCWAEGKIKSIEAVK